MLRERRTIGSRYTVVAADRLADARARLDSIAASAGPVTTEQAALAGLAHAGGIDALLYRGWGNRQVRRRMYRIAYGKLTAGDASPIADAAEAATWSVIHASAEEAMRAATDAAIQAAVTATAQASDAAQSAG